MYLIGSVDGHAIQRHRHLENRDIILTIWKHGVLINPESRQTWEFHMVLDRRKIQLEHRYIFSGQAVC